MRKVLLLLLCTLLAATLYAQRVSRDYRDCPMTDVLTDLSHAAGRERIIFIYNDLEDYIVTQRFDSLTIADAIRACIGFYPISLTLRGDSVLLVECTQKKPYKYIGRIVNERNLPVANASITLLSADNTLLNRGISNRNGMFVIPSEQQEATVKFTHVSYKPVSRRYHAGNIGTVRMETANIRIDSIKVTATPTQDAESRYYQLAAQVEQAVWNMDNPLFETDTIPEKYCSATAIVLADYDSLNYEREHREGKWTNTRHLHRKRYYINSQDTASELSIITYSKREDFTDFLFHKTTVLGVRIIGADGSRRLVNTHPYFKPQASRPAGDEDTDTIHIGRLKKGDILDVFTYHDFKEVLSPHWFVPQADYPTLHYEGLLRADKSVNLQLRESGLVAGRQMEDGPRRLLLRYDLQDYDDRSTGERPQASLYARTVRKGTAGPKSARTAGIVVNPSLADILDDDRFTNRQTYLKNIVSLKVNAFGQDSLSHIAAIRSIADEHISQREMADRLYRYFAGIYLYNGKPRMSQTQHIFYATNFFEAFVQALVLTGIPFDFAMTTRARTPPIDQLMDVDDIVWFVRLKDGTCYFPASGTPAGQTPQVLKGRKATLVDWSTYINL